MNIGNFILLSLAAAQLTFAAVENNIQQSVDACSIENIETTKGLVGRLYSVSGNLAALSSSTAYYQGRYSTESLIGSFDNTGAINFRVDGGQSTLYGLPLDTSHFVLEESGYFKGMFY